ncbi:unnamed protein product [Symbiodinium sp. CCMP2592]|nr:unnamed protein product [Symbiodinium sp. CCMP2592]
MLRAAPSCGDGRTLCSIRAVSLPTLTCPCRISDRVPSVWHFDFWRRLSLAGCCWVRLGGSIRRRQDVHCRSSCPGIHLIVDGDSHNTEEIAWALQKLEVGADPVTGTLFASPGRLRNKKWAQFVRDRGLLFHGVEKTGGYSDPTDEAIISHMRRLALLPDVTCIALLTPDSDFIPCAKQIQDTGGEIRILIGEPNRDSITRYREAGFDVVEVPPRREHAGYRVQAFLYSDGTGAVHTCEPIRRVYCDSETEALRKFLGQQGDWKDSHFLATCFAKHWFASSLGTLTVFPRHSAIMQMSRAVSAGRLQLQEAARTLAYFFPLGLSSKRKRKKSQRVGGDLAWKVSRSTGPFMLHDSETLTVRALQKLGYFDGVYNSDVSESMLVFANMSTNKRLLRETGNLPDATDSGSQLDAKIRQAFLSSATAGHWQVPPKDTQVRNLLFRDGCLPAENVSQIVMLSAMQLYCRRHGLPARQTYLGNVWQITQQINSADPDRREVVGGF